MALSDIIDFVTAKLATVTGVTHVLGYQPVETEPESIAAVMGASGSVQFWSVRREMTEELRLTNRETQRRHTIMVRGYMEVGAPSTSEPVFHALLEAVMAIFREDYRIPHGTEPYAELFGPMQCTEVGWVNLGNTLTAHRAVLSVVGQELIRRV